MTNLPQTEEQARIYAAMRNMLLKERVTYVLLTVFCAAFIFMIYSFCADLKTENKIIIAGFDALLSPTVYLMCKHFFMAKRGAKELWS
jgi:hypothetical protein